MGKNCFMIEIPVYSDLLWAINGTRTLPPNLTCREYAIFSFINEKINLLRCSGCQGIQDKFKKFDHDKATTYLAELIVAEYFLNRGHRVTLLGSNCFSRESPDMLVKTSDGEIFVEVAYMSSSDPISILFDNLRKITERYPYVVNFSFNNNVSMPHHDWNARNQQMNNLNPSVKQFETALEHNNFGTLPHHGETASFSYDIIERDPSGKGCPLILTSSCSTSLNFSWAYLTLRLQKKAKKRLTFPANKQKIPYLVALVCDEPGISSGELGYLLFGSTTHYDCFSFPSIPVEVREKQKNKRWNEILTELSARSTWAEIQCARENGWEDLLARKYLLPHDYCYVDKPGLFFTDSLLSQVSGLLFCRCSGNCELFPNPFSIDKMEYQPFWENL
jgi:hypothetical protein